MRFLLTGIFALVASGCAVFGAPEQVSVSSAPTTEPARAEPARFMPAFAAGAPVALVPCRGEAAFGGTCKRANLAHERRGEMPADENSETFSEATTVSLAKE